MRQLSYDDAQLILFADVGAVVLASGKWEAVVAAEEDRVDLARLYYEFRWVGGLQHLEENAAEGPHVLGLVVLPLQKNNLRRPVPPRTDVIGERPVLLHEALDDAFYLFYEHLLRILILEATVVLLIVSDVVSYPLRIAAAFSI